MRENRAFDVQDSSCRHTVCMYVGDNLSTANARKKVLSQKIVANAKLVKGGTLSDLFLYNVDDEIELELRKEHENVIRIEILDYLEDVEAEGKITINEIQEVMSRKKCDMNTFVTFKTEVYYPMTNTVYGTCSIDIYSSTFHPCISPANLNRSSSQLPVASFLRDFPGWKLKHGTYHIIHWKWNGPPNSKEEDVSEIFIHLFDHFTNEYLGPVHHGRAIPNTGFFSWIADADVQKDSHNPVYFAMTLVPWVGRGEVAVVARSHAMFLRKYLLLSELEIAYASYCRAYELDMEPITVEELEKYNINCSEENMRVCRDLRSRLAFENPDWECIKCPGQVMISPLSKLIYLKAENFAESKGEEKEKVAVYKSKAMIVTIVDDFILNDDAYWWEEATDFQVLVDGLSHYLPFRELHNLTLIPYHETSSLEWRRFLQYEIGGSFFKALFDAATMSFYFYVAMFPLFIAMVYNYIFHFSVDIEAHDSVDLHYIFDLFLVRSWDFITGRSQVYDWIWIIYGIFPMMVVVAIIIKVANRTYTINHQLQYMLTLAMTIHEAFTTFFITFFISSYILWSVVFALINSAVLLPMCVMTLSIAYVCYTTWSSYVGARNQINEFVKCNLDHLVTLAFDTWFESNNYPVPTYEELWSPHERENLEAKETMRLELLQAKRRAKSEVEAWQEKLREERSPSDKRPFKQSHFNHNTELAVQHMGEGKYTLSLIKEKKKAYRRYCIRKVSVKFFTSHRTEIGQYFTFDPETKALSNADVDRASGFPRGTRLASCQDYLYVLSRVGKENGILHGNEVVACSDGNVP